MLSLLAGGACATKSVFGSDVVPPGLGEVTVMASVPAAAISDAGIEARSSFGLTNVVSRALPLRFTTALGANPPPFTVSVNAGPPVATMGGKIDVTSVPTPDNGALCGEPGPLSETLMVADSLPEMDGANARPTSHEEFAASANEARLGHEFVFAGTKWKSAAFGPLMVKPVASTLRGAEVLFRRVASIVALIVPMPTGLKFTGVTATIAVLRMPRMDTACGLPAPLSVTFKVAVRGLTLPVGMSAVKDMPKKQLLPEVRLTLPVDSKLQLTWPTPNVGATNTLSELFVPLMLPSVTFRVAPPGLEHLRPASGVLLPHATRASA